MEISLTCGERLNLLGILPEEGNKITMRMIKDLTKKIELSSEEGTKVDLKLRVGPDGKGMYQWSTAKDFSTNIEIAESEISLIDDAFDKLDKGAKIKLHHLILIDKIKGAKDKASESDKKKKS